MATNCRPLTARIRTAVTCVSLALLASAGFAGEQVSAAPRLENEWLRVGFCPDTGRLTEFTDAQSGHNFVQAATDDRIWILTLRTADEERGVTSGDAKAFSFRTPQQPDGVVELVWEGFGLADAPGLRVTATVSLAADEPLALWRIAVEDAGPCDLTSITFPRIPGVTPQDDEMFAAPLWMGELSDNPRDRLNSGEKPGRWGWMYPGQLSLQCMTLYRQDGPGLFLSADDTDAFAKRFCAFGGPGKRVGLEVVHLPQGDSDFTHRYEVPYRVALGAFEGDWFTAAERYRQWALKQPWAAQSRLRTGGTADWVTDTGLWVWNRGRSDSVLAPAAVLKERTGVPVNVFWHWWHGCPYDVGFPEYLPPREGAESFRTAVAKAHEDGVHAMVYMNQRLWGMTTKSWTEKGAERYAVKAADGKIHPEFYNTFQHAPCASMCMGTRFWRDTYAGLAEEAVLDLGVDAIYMDQACLSLPCYDPTHGHPVGGGTYWVNGFRTLQADIRDRCKAGAPAHAAPFDVVLAGEGCGEAWLPHLDLMLSLQVSMERYAAPGRWRPIPFFHAVYHGYAVFFGNYSSLTMPPYDDLWPAEFAPKEPLKLLDAKFAQQFRLEHARSFVWGQQPTIANFRPSHLDDRARELAYLTRLVKIRLQALKYLLHGTMLRPPVVSVPGEEIDISRLSIYAGQKGGLQQYRKSCPSVLASAWQAPDGDVCVAVANVTDKPQQLSLALPGDAYPLPDNGAVFRIDADGRQEAGSVLSEGRVHVELPASDAAIYEFRRNKTR